MSSFIIKQSCSIGKVRRLQHIFSRDGKCLIVPIDDSLISGPKKGLSSLDSKIMQISAARPSAVLTYLGSASLLRHSEVPLILNLTASTVQSNHTNKVLISTVEQALTIDADAVAVHMNFSSKYESDMLSNIVQVKEKCDRYGMPLMILAYPRSECGEGINTIDQNYEALKVEAPAEYTEKVAHCVRIAFELGADIIKTQYTGTTDTFKRVVQSAQGVPVVIAGGHELDDDLVLSMVEGAMSAGASGISIGRNIFDRRSSDKMIHAIGRIVFNSENAVSAMDELL